MERTFSTPLVDIAQLAVPLLWAGLLIGVSFIATPVKFGATSLSLPVALDVGRVTFALFNIVEWITFAALVVAVVLSGPSVSSSAMTALLAALLATQTVWLLPVMNERIGAIIGGQSPPTAPYHWIYIGVDVTKVGLLIAMAWFQAAKLSTALSTTTQRP
jgi:hypothetical protein